MRTWERTWHLIFLAHIWALSPFAFLWLYNPGVARKVEPGHIDAMRAFTFGVVAYFAIRTFLALRSPRWLRWQFVFPPIDVVLVTIMLYIGDRDPLGNITIMYFLPIAEAAGTLNVFYAASIGLFSVLGSIAGSTSVVGLEKPFNIAFRLGFLVIMASLFTFLARRAAEFRSTARVAADRNRLALEMHDGVQAQLIAAASQMELAQLLAPTDGARAAEIAQQTRGALRRAADELRFLVQRLRTPSLGEGFLPALQQYSHHFCSRFGIALEFRTEGAVASLRPELENALFRIAQESLTNVVKHAEASCVEIRLTFTSAEVRMEIRDDGTGIADPEPTGGVGLESMRERAESVGGAVEIASSPQGTHLRTRIPVDARGRTHG